MAARLENPAEVLRWLQQEVVRLSPVALGSLSLRKTRCIRDRCHPCQTGEQHPSYVLYGRQKGRRFARYVPDELAPEIRRALAHGRALQELLHEAGRRYLEALKRERRRDR